MLDSMRVTLYCWQNYAKHANDMNVLECGKLDRYVCRHGSVQCDPANAAGSVATRGEWSTVIMSAPRIRTSFLGRPKCARSQPVSNATAPAGRFIVAFRCQRRERFRGSDSDNSATFQATLLTASTMFLALTRIAGCTLAICAFLVCPSTAQAAGTAAADPLLDLEDLFG